MYMGLFFMKIPLIQLALSTGTYATVCYGSRCWVWPA